MTENTLDWWDQAVMTALLCKMERDPGMAFTVRGVIEEVCEGESWRAYHDGLVGHVGQVLAVQQEARNAMHAARFLQHYLQDRHDQYGMRVYAATKAAHNVYFWQAVRSMDGPSLGVWESQCFKAGRRLTVVGYAVRYLRRHLAELGPDALAEEVYDGIGEDLRRILRGESAEGGAAA